jgi:hypothetical protein
MRTKIKSFRDLSLKMGRMYLSGLAIVLTCILLSTVSCSSDEDNPDPEVIFMATLNGASETPPNASEASGTATLTYNKDTKIFTIVVTYSGVTASAAHIHKAAVGVPGGVVFPFSAPLTSPINYTSPVLTTSQDSALNANLYYVNIHSEMYGGGEIRGQLIKQ